jgi:MFS family permease
MFYGWYVLSALLLVRLLKAPGQNNVFAISVPVLLDSLSLDPAAYGRLWGIATLVAAFFQPLLGRSFDRYGLRRSLPCGVALLGAGLCALSATPFAYPQRDVNLFVAAVFIRGTAIGCLDTYTQGGVALWFKRTRGRAASLMQLTSGFPAGLLTLAIEKSDARFGWRTTYASLGAIALAATPALCCILRDRPEDVGQRTDGDAATIGPAPGAAAVATGGAAMVGSESSVALSDLGCAKDRAAATPTGGCGVRPSRPLVVICLNAFLRSTVASGIDLYTVPIALEAGADYDIGAMIFLPIGVVASVACLLAGCLMDNGHAPQHQLAIANVALAVVTVAATRMGAVAGAATFVIARGFFNGVHSMA